MEQIKPNIANIYLKTAALPPIEACIQYLVTILLTHLTH